MATPSLVLWDIDRTLLSVGPLGREIHAAAFEAVVGRPLGERADTTGRTERAILRDTLRLNGAAVDEAVLSALYVAMGAAAERLEARMRQVGEQMPGARAAVASLASSAGPTGASSPPAGPVVQSVVTGNLRSVSAVKLRALGLAEHLDLAVGGYGDDDADRAGLVRQAVKRAEAAYDLTFDPARTVVIGDTPHDMKGARDAGVRAVGVATGTTTMAGLAAAGADAALADLTDLTALRLAVLCDGDGLGDGPVERRPGS
ncbi:HAD family hydrolase [Parafrankia discariae]|uniref:HAD family hydrolase n=1 Tax=Parafrankia discariae TaxID=365528 RepID=UPI000376EA98|nr:haloacid dehalogenase-like hydrolase [Parafrankia discariae]